MSTKSMLHQAKLNEWATRFADQKASGLTVPRWCEQNSFSTYQYYYWKRLLKEEAIEQVLPDIVPLAFPSTTTTSQHIFPTSEVASATRTTCTTFASPANARIMIGNTSIELFPNASEEFICNLIKAVRNA